ncbi:hypothetical protein [Allokutzneria oryzae]|uniref:Small secreted hydrophilic protein n=1 Tax=Allokutzneria oryzae TaxID=1378989 RepID=A0ABV6A054_9PSEU
MTPVSRLGIVSLVAAGVIGVTTGVYAFAGPTAAPPQVTGEARMSPAPSLANHVQLPPPPGAPIAPVLCDDDDDLDDLRDDLDDLDDRDDLDDVNDPDDDPDDDLYDDDCRR